MHFNNDTDLYRTIGSNIKHYRQQANLTQMQLAEKAQISISYLSKIEASGCDKVFPYLYLIALVAELTPIEMDSISNKQHP